jgi:uncharacterized damage-inducible protein DinB
MVDPEWCVMMAEYNAWMNDKVYAACAGMTDAERKADRKAFFKSIHSTLNHLLWGDRAWFGRFNSHDYGQPKVGNDLYADFAELKREREATDIAMLEWTKKLDAKWLESELTWKSGIDGKTRTLPYWVVVTQMFNHQTHHRGQLTTLLAQGGIDIGETDLPWLPALGAVRDQE